MGAAVTAAVAEDVATDEPYLFDAVTLTRSVYPTSPETGLYEDDVGAGQLASKRPTNRNGPTDTHNC